MTEPQFRPMSSTDQPLRKRCVDRNIGDYALPLSAEQAETFQSFHPQRGDAGLVATIDGDVAGVAWVTFARGNDTPDLVTSVVPAHQGKRVGRTLIEKMVEHARTQKWPGLTIALSESHPARRMFARMGFETLDDGQQMRLYLRAPIQRVAVYCGSAKGARGDYVDDAEALGAQLAARGIDLVYGGGSVGLMGALGTAVISHGGTAIGVMPRELVDREMAHPDLTTLDIVDTMAQRKTRMEELADAFIALPGGVGTLEELFQVFTGQQLGHHANPIALINTEGFYNPLLASLHRMCEEGFIQDKYLDALIVTESIPELFEALDSWRNPGTKW